MPKKIFSRSRIIVIGIIVAVVVLGYWYFGGTKKQTYQTIPVERGTLMEEVSVTGNVTPAQSASLAFEKGGKVKGIYVDVGVRVSAGEVLAETDNGELAAGLLDAQANLESERAKLGELTLGTRPEEVRIAETKVNNAEIARQDAEQNLQDKVADAYTKSDDAIRNQVDQLISNPRGSTPQFNFALTDSQLKINIEQSRFLVEKLLVDWQKDVATLLGVNINLKSSAALAEKNLASVKSILDNVALAVNSLLPSSSLSQTTIDGYKADINTARTNINTAIVNLTAARSSLRSAESALLLSRDELTLKKSGATPGDIAGETARVKQAEAKVEVAQAQLGKTILHSPIAGIVTKKDAKVGEIVAPNAPVLSVISDQNLEIDVNVPETDIAKVNIGDPAKITLDPYGETVVFEAIVESIDPASTVVEGVPTYKTTLYFKKSDSRVKSGMTANITIETDKRENTLAIPNRAVSIKDGKKIVTIENADKTLKEVIVETGMKGSDGRVEIISGLKEGDLVVITTVKK